jgi:hypothetical protein
MVEPDRLMPTRVRTDFVATIVVLFASSYPFHGSLRMATVGTRPKVTVIDFDALKHSPS